MSNDTLSLKTVFFAVGVLGVLIACILWIGSMANKKRQAHIIEEYTKETDTFVSLHKDEAKKLFTETFDQCAKFLEKQNSIEKEKGTYYNSSAVECFQAQQQLAKLEVGQLKDSSSTLYIRIVEKKYDSIDASGMYHSLSQIPNSTSRWDEEYIDVEDALVNHKPIKVWKNFFYFIGSKQVIVPVVVENQTIGYIVRGVVER